MHIAHIMAKGQTEAYSDQKERVVPFIKLHSSVKERGSYTAFRSYSVELRGYVMIPGYFVAKLWDCLHDYSLWIFLQLC